RVGYTSTTPSDSSLMALTAELARDIPGVSQVGGPREFGAGDDAVLMMQRVPARGGRALYLGLGSPVFGGHHTTRFDFDERALAIGAELFLRLALSRLQWGGPHARAPARLVGCPPGPHGGLFATRSSGRHSVRRRRHGRRPGGPDPR